MPPRQISRTRPRRRSQELTRGSPSGRLGEDSSRQLKNERHDVEDNGCDSAGDSQKNLTESPDDIAHSPSQPDCDDREENYLNHTRPTSSFLKEEQTRRPGSIIMAEMKKRAVSRPFFRIRYAPTDFRFRDLAAGNAFKGACSACDGFDLPLRNSNSLI